MGLCSLKDRDLLMKTKVLVKKERLLLENILLHLQEIHRRRLYADLGYSNLFKYLVRELHYSEGAAARRVQALKLIQKVPEAKDMIKRGDLNLTTFFSGAEFHQGEVQRRDPKSSVDRKGKD